MCRFRTLCQLGLLATVAFGGFAACGDDSPHTTSGGGDAQIELTWQVGYLPDTSPTGPLTPATCEALKAVSVRVDAYDATMKSVYHTMWPCQDGIGVTGAIPAGSYFIGVALLDANNTVLTETDPGAAVAEVRRGRVWQFNQPVLFGLQSFPLTWQIFKGANRQFCADVGATDVQLVADSESSGTLKETVAKFPCGTMTAASQPVEPGLYRVTLRLLDKDGKSLAESTQQFVTAPADVRAKLDPFKFTLP